MSAAKSIREALHQHYFTPWYVGARFPACRAKCRCGVTKSRRFWTDFEEYNQWVAEGEIRYQTDAQTPIEWLTESRRTGPVTVESSGNP